MKELFRCLFESLEIPEIKLHPVEIFKIGFAGKAYVIIEQRKHERFTQVRTLVDNEKMRMAVDVIVIVLGKSNRSHKKGIEVDKKLREAILKEERKKEKKNKKESHLKGRRGKKPKGNGIKDGLVRWLCVYAVVFWFF